MLRSIGSIPLTFFITAAIAAAVAIWGVGAVGALASSVVDTGNEVMLKIFKVLETRVTQVKSLFFRKCSVLLLL